MPVIRTATKKAASAVPKPVKTQRRSGKSTREAVSRRAFQEWSDRFDRELDLLVADTKRLAAEILRK